MVEPKLTQIMSPYGVIMPSWINISRLDMIHDQDHLYFYMPLFPVEHETGHKVNPLGDL